MTFKINQWIIHYKSEVLFNNGTCGITNRSIEKWYPFLSKQTYKVLLCDSKKYYENKQWIRDLLFFDYITRQSWQKKKLCDTINNKKKYL